MVTLIASLIGFFSSLVPDGLKFLRDAADRKHELTISLLQLEQQRQGQSSRLEEIRVQADASEVRAFYKTWRTGVEWVDALNGTVRPVLAYSFFLLYALVKAWQFSLLPDAPLPWHLEMLWNEEDRAIFAGIIAFYFGQRAMAKVRR